jgi:hypothetical protein
MQVSKVAELETKKRLQRTCVEAASANPTQGWQGVRYLSIESKVCVSIVHQPIDQVS